MYSKHILSLPFVLPVVSAICPGYNFAFFNDPHSDGYAFTSNDACAVVETAHCSNVCECNGLWSCSTAHSVDSAYVDGLWYACTGTSNAGTCGHTGNQLANVAPESCCRNDGKRNYEEGLISKRHADAIAETNAVLERHEQEHANASRNGQDTAKLRRRQLVELDGLMKREASAAALGN